MEQISTEDLGRLGIRDQLFWDGRRVETRLTLTRFQKIIASVAAICAVLGALGGFVTGLNNASVFLCTRGLSWLTCPLPKLGAPQPR